MGGIGSGRPCSNRLTTECFRLDVRRLERAKLLEAGRIGTLTLSREGLGEANLKLRFMNGWLILDCDRGRDLFGPRQSRFHVRVGSTICNYGGSRSWLICPGPGCARAMTVLYGVGDFLCRRCRRVTYPIQRVAPLYRALARAQKLRVQLGGSADITVPFPERPKGMHHWTYTKIALRAHAAEAEANQDVFTLLGRPRPGSESRGGASTQHCEPLFRELSDDAGSSQIATGSQNNIPGNLEKSEASPKASPRT